MEQNVALNLPSELHLYAEMLPGVHTQRVQLCDGTVLRLGDPPSLARGYKI